MDMERPYYKDINYKPLIFYVVFGVDGDEMKVSKSKHHVDEIPEGVEIQGLKRETDSGYMSAMMDGFVGEVLKRENEELYNACVACDQWVVIRGDVVKDDTLDYMRNTIGIIQALLEQGGKGVFDFQIFTLYSAEQWTDKFFEKEINAQEHVTVLVSEEAEGVLWLHTRGLFKFGRPDLSIHGVTAETFTDSKQVIDQMVYYSGLGMLFNRPIKFHLQNGKIFLTEAKFVNDFDNDDFNNAYYEVKILEDVTE